MSSDSVNEVSVDAGRGREPSSLAEPSGALEAALHREMHHAARPKGPPRKQPTTRNLILTREFTGEEEERSVEPVSVPSIDIDATVSSAPPVPEAATVAVAPTFLSRPISFPDAKGRRRSGQLHLVRESSSSSAATPSSPPSIPEDAEPDPSTLGVKALKAKFAMVQGNGVPGINATQLHSAGAGLRKVPPPLPRAHTSAAPVVIHASANDPKPKGPIILPVCVYFRVELSCEHV